MQTYKVKATLINLENNGIIFEIPICPKCGNSVFVKTDIRSFVSLPTQCKCGCEFTSCSVGEREVNLETIEAVEPCNAFMLSELRSYFERDLDDLSPIEKAIRMYSLAIIAKCIGTQP
jgi:ribosomal protein S27AE